MAVNPPSLEPPLSVPGFRVGVASCGVKSPEIKGKRNDVTFILSDVDAQAAAVFTQNRFRAACVDLGEQAMAVDASHIRAIIANAGNANAGVGTKERLWAQGFIDSAAVMAGIKSTQVLSASTGVVGTPFPLPRIKQGMHEAMDSLSPDGWEAAAHAICTTDTFAKYVSRKTGDYTITGIAKGSGMIHPDMATMLSFIATDAPIAAAELQSILKRAVHQSFNCISVDGDTSTNDTVYLLSSGLGLKYAPLSDTEIFESALIDVCTALAKMIVRDGEGVSKFITIKVTGAENEADARQVGRAIAISSLVKTAFAGSDANWGRILVAMGNSGVSFEPQQVSLWADDVCMLKNGNLHPDYHDEKGMVVFAKDEFFLHVDLATGHASSIVWTGDLTHEYIRINAEYRT